MGAQLILGAQQILMVLGAQGAQGAQTMNCTKAGNDPVFYFEEVSWVHLVFCFALVSRRRFITSLKGALLFLFIRSKVDRSLRVICKHKTLNQANVGAGRLISPKYTFTCSCGLLHISILLSVSIDPK